jgi:ATP-dependent Clp protease, protease subunit
MNFEAISRELAIGRRHQAAAQSHIQQWFASRERKFSAEASAEGTDLEINIFDVIGCGYWYDGVSAKTVKRALDANPNAKVIRVVMDTPGGDAFDGVAIQNLLKRHPAKVIGEVVGEASSAGSIVLMGCDEIVMHQGSMMMIHQASGGCFGTYDDLVTIANALKGITESLIDVYATRTGRPRDEISELVMAETWMKADEAVSMKFADKVEPARSPGAAKPTGTTAPAPAPAENDDDRVQVDVVVHEASRAENLITASRQSGSFSVLANHFRPPITGLADTRTSK